jgi:SsrA-binding protein
MKVFNRSFERNYEKLEEFEAGVQLTGAEAKSVFLGRIILDAAYVRIMEDGNAYLVNADIPKYEFAQSESYDSKRRRRVLLHKKELLKYQTKSAAKGYSLIPLSCYATGRYIKLSVALARGRRDLEKKKIEKKREIVRDQKREMKEYMKR